MCDCAAQFLCRDNLIRHGFHHIGAGDKHIARIFHHEDEIGHRGAIDRAHPHMAP
jgi:hypothetical protein